jgi:hypothetical protein
LVERFKILERLPLQVMNVPEEPFQVDFIPFHGKQYITHGTCQTAEAKNNELAARPLLHLDQLPRCVVSTIFKRRSDEIAEGIRL